MNEFTIIKDRALFRAHISQFKGAQLAVFAAICFNVDEQLICRRTYEQIIADTGYGSNAVAAAIDALCKIEVNGEPVVVKLGRKGGNHLERSGYKISSQAASMLAHEGHTPATQGPSINNIKPGYIYLIDGLDTPWYKIGLSKNANVRSADIAAKLPFDTALVALHEVDNMIAAEAALHERYAASRGRGEWFTLSQADVDEIVAAQWVDGGWVL